ncbi:unnamed protein product [Camellia sinensis]
MKRNKFTAIERDQISSVLEWAFVRLEAWFQWFNTTQSETLTSGLDDYPCASHPIEDERHLDLRCWMFLAADCMHSISKLLQKEHELGKEYDSTAKLLSNFEILNQMHFDDAHGSSFDLVRSNGKQPLCKSRARPGSFRTAKIEFSMYMKYNTEHDAPYWRGPIWMNINYMIISSLHHYSKENGPYRDKAKIIYNDLRSNMIR